MEGVLWYRMLASIDGLLFPNQDAEFEALPSRRDQEQGALWIGRQILLEVVGRNVWGLVHI